VFEAEEETGGVVGGAGVEGDGLGVLRQAADGDDGEDLHGEGAGCGVEGDLEFVDAGVFGVVGDGEPAFAVGDEGEAAEPADAARVEVGAGGDLGGGEVFERGEVGGVGGSDEEAGDGPDEG
jgi:hypothetical protein